MTEGSGNGTLEQLKEKGTDIGLPSRLIEFYQELLDLQARGEKQIGTINPGLKKEEINERLSHGRPLINYNEIAFKWEVINSLFVQVIDLFSRYEDLFGKVPDSLKKRKTIPRNLVKAWYKKSPLPASLATDDADELLLMDAIIHATVKPNLVCYARALSGLIDQEKWKQNVCPVCGGLPDLAYLEEKEGARWLVCSRCDTEWLFKRLECPYCKNNDQSKLGYFTDDDTIYRLYVCEKCRRYIKTIDLRVTEKKILFPVERILTINIDNQARADGYEPGIS